MMPLAAAALGACSQDDSPDTAAPQLEVRLTDAPGDHEAVLVEVVDVGRTALE